MVTKGHSVLLMHLKYIKLVILKILFILGLCNFKFSAFKKIPLPNKVSDVALACFQLQFFTDFYNLILSISPILTNFVIFAISLSTLSRFKRTNGSGIIMMPCTGLHKFVNVIFGITQKSLYIASSNLVKNT